VAYRADIEIAVRGAQELKRLQNQIKSSADAVSSLNSSLNAVANLLPRSFNNLNKVVGEAAANFNEVALGTKEASDAARDYYQASKTLNNALRERLNLLNSIQRAERGTVLTNIAASQAARTVSGFGEFSASIESTTAVEKSIRRNKERVARQPKAPLALPSSEMLQAEQRGLQQLSTYYGNLNTKVDTGVQKGRAFTEQLDQSARSAQTLPPIFNQVQQTLQGIVKATAEGSAVQVSWAKVLGEFPRIQADILKSQLAEIKLNKESLEVDYARLEARKRMQRIEAFDKGQEARAKRTRELNESLALGVGFPLLFGGGVGSVAGSFAGSFAGKGFGGQIIGGALGQVVENTIRSIAKITSSLDDIVAAAGIAGTATERHIEALKKAGKEEEALAVATAALANVVGQDGVKALKDFEVAGTTMANSLSQLATQLAAKAAQALQGPASGIAGALEESALFGQAQQSRDAEQIANFTKLARVYGQEYYDTLSSIYQRQRELNIEAEKNLNTNKEVASIRQVDKNALSAELELAKTNGNIVNDTVYRLKEKVIEQRTYVALQDALEKGLETESILLREQIDLQQLRQEREEAIVRAAEKARQEVEARLKAQLNLEKALYDEQIRLIALNVREIEFSEGVEASLDRKLMLLPKEAKLRAEALSVERKQALQEAARNGTIKQTLELFELKRRILEIEYNLEKDITQEKRAQLRVEEFQKTLNATQQAAKPFVDFRKQQSAQVGFAKTYNRLINEGILPAEAERRANFENISSQELDSIDRQIQLTEAVIKQAELEEAKTEDYEKQLKLLKLQKSVIEDQATLGPGKGQTDAERLEDAIAAAKGDLLKLTDPINQVITGAKAIGSAFRDAFTGLVSGAMTGQEALAAFFKGVGDHFMDMAAQMIAKLIEIYILKTVLGFISGSAGGGGGGGDQSTIPSTGTPAAPTVNGFDTGSIKNIAADGAYWSGGFRAFANGGMVTRPTLGLIGEGGEAEYIIPASKMRGAMNRYAAGARGSAVIPAGDGEGEGGMGGTATLAPGAIDVRYSVERINSVDYVTADQFQRGMQQAAQQGAAQGQQMTLRKLQQSPATRRRVGI